jgi:uncharacterized protein YjbI with pentapeptide repeats
MSLRTPGFTEKRRRVQRIWERLRRFSTGSNLPYALLMMVVCLAIALVWERHAATFLTDIRVEFWGLIFDIFFILVVFSFFEHRRQRLLQVQIQHDIIEDYKSWDSEEARFRLAGAIRRLNKMGVNAIDLSGARISDFSFAKNSIPTLVGSTFYDGTWGEVMGEASVILKSVAFDHVDCRSVTFSPHDPFSGLALVLPRYAAFVDCSFLESDLRGAKFNGASLKWTKAPPESHFDFEEDPETGQTFSIPVSYGPFNGAELSKASFADAIFENADFRGASGVLDAEFSKAKGLDGALFDDEKTKASVLAKVALKKS